MTRTDVGQRERVNFYMDTQILDGLKKLAQLKNMTYSELIRQACREYVVREGARAIADQQTIRSIGQ